MVRDKLCEKFLPFSRIERNQSGVQDADWAWGTDAVDLDNDGDLDIVVVNGFGSTPNRLFQNNGDGTFTEVGADAGFASLEEGRGVSALDYDLDGDLDLIVFNHGSPVRLLRNETIRAAPSTHGVNTIIAVENEWILRDPADAPGGGGANYLRILLDTQHRPDLAPEGIGAWMRVTAGDKVHHRYIHADPTYVSNSERVAHIGLGVAAQADQVEVAWHEGTIVTLDDVAANQTITISAPSFCALADSNADGAVDGADLSVVLKDWGPGDGSSDLNNDGVIDGLDLSLLLNSWGPCP